MNIQRLILVLTAAVAALSTFAMPAYPGRRLVKLPDGTLREVYIRGDEYSHWLESPSGLRLTKPVASVARPFEGINSKSVHHVASSYSSSVAADKPMLVEGTFPTTGKRKLLAVLVNYANTTPTYAPKNFEALMNQKSYGGIGSFRDYYLDQSYGQLDITTTVTRWVTLMGNKSYYSDNVQEIIHEALTAVDSEIDFREFDNDGDGMLDGLLILHQGSGYEASGDATDIWSHSGVVYGMQFDGVTINRYTIQPELFANRAQMTNRMTGIGVICHEFGHNLGALDYYDTDYSANQEYGGTGVWDLMGSGGWNGPEGYGEAPAPFMMWQKVQFGWLKPQVLTDSETISAMPASGETPVCYRLNTSIEGDYYILENRQNVSPWDANCPGHGLLVSHAIESVIRERMAANTINSRYPQGFYVVASHAGKDPIDGRPDSYGVVNEALSLYGGMGRGASLSDDTKPSCRSVDGRNSYVTLQDIAETTEECMTFRYVKGDAPARPEALTAIVYHGNVVLSWQYFSATGEQPLFSIYRDGMQIATTRELSYVDSLVDSQGIITYSVDAAYESGLLSAYATASTRIPVNKATDLAFEIVGDEMQITWKQPTELTRCVDNMKYTALEHVAADLSFAHRFRPDDLLPYVGYKIRSVSFIPNQPSTSAKFEVCVWRTEPGKNTPELIASREVKEYSPAYKKQVVLTQQPTIEAGYEYWVGVHMVCANNYAQLICDQSELLDGYANWISYGGTKWQRDPAAVNNYVLSAALVAPVASEQSLDIPDFAEVDPSIDFYYPIAYQVYADDILLATTAATSYKCPVPEGDLPHTIAVASLYKGGNESRSLTYSVVPQGVEAVLTAQIADAPAYDLTGRRIYGNASGIYVKGGKCIIR